MPNTETLSVFAQDFKEGMSQSPKFISSKYFYDENGSRLFEEIMELPEYYLTNAEQEVLEMHAREIARSFHKGCLGIKLIELGAGNGMKTRILLDELEREGRKTHYCPIDISEDAIVSLKENIGAGFSAISVEPLVGDYFESLEALHADQGFRKVVMFLGSNIGNFTWEQSVSLLEHILEHLEKGDLLFIGFDQKKQPQRILSAYSDKQGVTRAFNLNLLQRANRELDARFNLDAFDHYASYDPESGEARSYLVSLEKQRVWIGELEEHFELEKWECIHTETSRKYDSWSMDKLASRVGCKPLSKFYDREKGYCNALWEKR